MIKQEDVEKLIDKGPKVTTLDWKKAKVYSYSDIGSNPCDEVAISPPSVTDDPLPMDGAPRRKPHG